MDMSILVLCYDSPSLVFFEPSVVESDPSTFLVTGVVATASATVGTDEGAPTPLGARPVVEGYGGGGTPPADEAFVFSTMFLRGTLTGSTDFPLRFPVRFEAFLVELFFRGIPTFVLLAELECPVEGRTVMWIPRVERVAVAIAAA